MSKKEPLTADLIRLLNSQGATVYNADTGEKIKPEDLE